MKWIAAALVLGIFLNMSTAGGNSWPIGSVIAVVLMGLYLKRNQDQHFEELKNRLEKIETQMCADSSIHKNPTITES